MHENIFSQIHCTLFTTRERVEKERKRVPIYYIKKPYIYCFWLRSTSTLVAGDCSIFPALAPTPPSVSWNMCVFFTVAFVVVCSTSDCFSENQVFSSLLELVKRILRVFQNKQFWRRALFSLCNVFHSEPSNIPQKSFHFAFLSSGNHNITDESTQRMIKEQLNYLCYWSTRRTHFPHSVDFTNFCSNSFKASAKTVKNHAYFREKNEK